MKRYAVIITQQTAYVTHVNAGNPLSAMAKAEALFVSDLSAFEEIFSRWEIDSAEPVAEHEEVSS